MLTATLVLAVGPLAPVAQAQPDVGAPPDVTSCYGVADEAFGDSGGAPDGLSKIDRSDGSTENIGAQTGTTDVEAIAFAPGTIVDPAITQQVLYAFDGVDFGFLNLTSGLFSSLGRPAPAGFTTVDGMTWDADLQVFWVTDRLGDDGAADQVAAYDPFTGATTIGPFATGIATQPDWTNDAGLPYDDFDDIAIDPQEDFRLYALLNKGGFGGGLVELSKVDGSIIDYLGLFTPVNAASDFDGDGVTDDIEGLAFFDDRQLYGSTGANGPGADINRLFVIDLMSGSPVTQYIGDFVGYGDYEALGCLTFGASINVEKGTAEPGGVPEDADDGPGPTITTRNVEWTYLITNTSSGVSLTAISLEDSVEGLLFLQETGESRCAEGVILAQGAELAPNETLTCTVTGITVAGPYTNTATTVGTADPGSGLREIVVTDIDPSNYFGEPEPPALEVVKTAVPGPNADCGSVVNVPGDGDVVAVTSGDSVTFCVTVTNVGGSDAVAVTVTDDNATPQDAADDFVVTGLDDIDLAVGASATGSYDVTVTSLAPLRNTVTAVGTDPVTNTPTNSPTDPALVQALSSPLLDVVKTIVAGTSDCVGITPAPGLDSITVATNATVTYCVTVTNVGITEAANVTVTDDNLTPADPADDVQIPDLVDLTLAANESATGALVTTAGAAGTNTVTATGIDPNTGNPTNSPSDPAAVQLLGGPVLEVVKTVVAGTSDCAGVTPVQGPDDITVEFGATVTYCVTVTNTGATPAANVTVTDDNLTPADPADDVDVPGLIDIGLARGESATGALVTTANAAGVNTVTATGTDPNTGNPTNEPTDPAEVQLLGPPVLDVVKTIVAGTSDCVGVNPEPGADSITVEINATVTYCVTVTNTGDTFATGVTVTDDNLTPADPADDVQIPGLIDIRLEAGASATGALVTTASAAGTNTVTATGIDPITGNPTNEPTDPAEVRLLGTPILDVVKTVVAGTSDCSNVTPVEGPDDITVEFGATVTYCITVTNTGETAAANVTVTDNNLTPADPGDDVNVPDLVNVALAPGESATGALVSTATLAGTNTVTATGTDPNTGNPTNEPTDPAEVKLLGSPSLEVVKTIVAGTSDCVGVTPAPGLDEITVETNATVTYCVTVTNTGATFATGVTVTDDNLTPDVIADDVQIPGLIDIRLDAGASATGALVTTASAAGTNTVTATGIDPITGNPTNSPTDPAEVKLLGPPILDVIKTVVAGTSDCANVTPIDGADAVTVEFGATVTYCVTVTNTGATAAANVTVTDDNLTPADPADDVDVPGLADIDLAPGESATGALVTTASLAGVNTVTATGTDPNTGDPTNEPTDPAEIKLLGSPSLEVVKTVVAGTSDCVGVTPAPGLDDIVVEINSSVTYCVTVTNTGATFATGVTVTDDNLTPNNPADDVQIPGLIDIRLEAGASATGALVITASEAGTNTVTATGIDPITGNPTNSPTDPAEVKLLGPPILQVVKTAVPGTSDCANVTPIDGADAVTVEFGATVTYCVTVTNTGATAAANVTVTDDNLTPADPADDVDIPGLADIDLAPGESATGALVTTASLAGINTVTATGTDPNTGNPTNEPTDPAEIKLLGSPSLEVVKTVVAGTSDCVGVNPAPGVDSITVETNATVTYCVTVTNTGATFATGVTVTDDNLTPTDADDDVQIPGLIDIRLDAGASATGALVTTASAAGTNTVTATGTDPITGNPTNSPTDPAEVKLLGLPFLEVIKTAVIGTSDCVGVVPAAGPDDIVVEIDSTVTFCITVANSGETVATGVTVVDDRLTPADPTDDIDVPGLIDITLAPGESATGALVLTADSAGVNTVTATGIDPNTGDPTNSPADPAEVRFLGGPVLEVVKTAVAGTSDCVGVNPAPGLDEIVVEINSSVTYCVTVTNTGGTFATGVTVTDDNLTPNDPADDVQIPGLIDIRLEAGASATGALVISASDAGTNTVTATGTDPVTGDPTNSPTDPAEVKLLGPPILEVVKTAVSGTSDCTTVTPAPGIDELPVAIGDVVTFCVTVTNIGDTAAEQVTVTDDNFTPSDPTDDVIVEGLDQITLASGASATGSFSFTVESQTELTNTVTATGVDPNTGDPTNEPTDRARLVPPTGNAELDIVKTVVVGGTVDCATVDPMPGEDAVAVEIGDSVTFCITVSNIGTGPAADVVVVDNNFTVTDTTDDTIVQGLNGIDLAAGASATGSVVVVVSDLEPKTNIAQATGTDVNGDRPTNEPDDPSRLVPFGTPILTVTKTAVAGTDVDCSEVAPVAGLDQIPAAVGDSVTFCIVVTNTGDGPATDVQATDDNLTPNDSSDDVVVVDVATLAPGASATGSFVKVVETATAAQRNSVTATGTDPNTGLPTNEPTDPAGFAAPAIELVKQILRGADQAGNEATEGVNELIIGSVGEEITWVYTVENTGSVPLLVQEIVDPSIDVVVPIPAGQQLLVPGAMVTVTANDLVTETGATSEATVQGQPVNVAGEPVPGLEPLMAANDAAEGPARVMLTKQILRGNDRDCADATEGVNEIVVGEPGDEITWCFTITNTGVTAVTDVRFTDVNLDIADLDALATTGQATLAPNESILLPGQNDVVPAGGVDSAALVLAVPSDSTGDITGPAFVGAPQLADTNNASNDSISIKLEKRVLLGFDADCSTAVEGINEAVRGRLGDDITWCFTAINTGSVALRITEIIDDTLEFTLQVPEDQQIVPATVEPFSSITLQENGVIDRDTVENVATVVGSAVDVDTGEILIDVESGDPVPRVEDTNTATKRPLSADLRLDKSKVLPAAPLAPGSVIEYRLEIENKGPDTAQGVEVLDTLPAGLEYVTAPEAEGWACLIDTERGELLCERDRLRVGIIETLSYEVRLTQAAPANTSLVNTATVDFLGVDPTPEDNTDTETVRIIRNPTPCCTIPDEEIPDPPPEEEDEVLPLVVTGAHTDLMLAVAMVSIQAGGVFLVLSRRRREDEQNIGR